ncbi:hypothetical protein Tco_1333285 [Tanacetum coccineum]
MNEEKGIMPTKIELTLEQSQQGASNDVLVTGTGYSLKDKNKAKNDKTKHENEENMKAEKSKSKPKPKVKKYSMDPLVPI